MSENSQSGNNEESAINPRMKEFVQKMSGKLGSCQLVQAKNDNILVRPDAYRTGQSPTGQNAEWIHAVSHAMSIGLIKPEDVSVSEKKQIVNNEVVDFVQGREAPVVYVSKLAAWHNPVARAESVADLRAEIEALKARLGRTGAPAIEDKTQETQDDLQEVPL